MHLHIVQLKLKSRNFIEERKEGEVLVMDHSSALSHLCYSARGPQSTGVSTTSEGGW